FHAQRLAAHNHHGPTASRGEPCPRRGRIECLMAANPERRPRRAGKKVMAEELQPHQYASAAGGWHGLFSSPQPNLAAAHDPYDRVRFRVVDRVLQYRESAAGSRAL